MRCGWAWLRSSAPGGMPVAGRCSARSGGLRRAAEACDGPPASPHAIAPRCRISTSLGTVERSQTQSRLLWSDPRAFALGRVLGGCASRALGAMAVGCLELSPHHALELSLSRAFELSP